MATKKTDFLACVNLAPLIMAVFGPTGTSRIIPQITCAGNKAPTTVRIQVVIPDVGKERWIEQAQRKIAAIKRWSSAIARNHRINRAYAEMYLSDRATFKWAGLAAFASHSIGDKMRLLRLIIALCMPAGLIALWQPIAAVPVVAAIAGSLYMYNRTATGNKMIYADIYWQHIAYQKRGMAEVERLYKRGDVPLEMYKAWQKIEMGRRVGDDQLVWKGNTALLKYEQERVIQPILYDGRFNRLLWKAISLVHDATNILLTSPVPGDPRTFRDNVRYGNVSLFRDRWLWCIESIMPRWLATETRLNGHVTALLQKM